MRSVIPSVLLRVPVLALTLTLGACGFSLFKAAPPLEIYDVRTSPQSAPGAHAEWQLVVAEPATTPALDTDRMLLRRSPQIIEYVANSKWSARPPNIIQTQLLLAFEHSGRLSGVSRDELGLRRDFDLTGDLRAFDTVYNDGLPSAHVVLDLKLVRRPAGTIAAMRTFEATEAAGTNSLTQITGAFDRALTKVVADAVAWTFSVGEGDWQQRPPAPKAAH
jgi:cholesterol transport system auxiliary component